MTFEHSNIAPDFIIIGAMKSATSAIYEYLMQHPLVARRMPKELHFFTLNYDRGLDWYSSQFAPAKQQQLLVGEASPGYFPSATAASLIYKSFPNAKIILSLRNPRDRAISHYYHQLNRVKDENRPIEVAFSSQEIAELQRQPYTKTSSYIQLGKYTHQVKRWLNVFPREQLIILNYHNLQLDTNLFMGQVFDFLELPQHTIPDTQKIYANQYPPVSEEIKNRLDSYFQIHNQELNDAIGIDFNVVEITA